jgi:hypothetical protein
VSATETVAQSHEHLARKLETDVERPLRDYSKNNREIQAMGNISGNLAATAREIDSAQRKVGKLKDKGPKAKASAMGDAIEEVEKAELSWDSSAPYVFEQLQAIDESRLNHLRDVLTQFQTHEMDQVERSKTTVEETLMAMLNIETADEIQTWALRMRSGEMPAPARKISNAATGTPSRSLAAPLPPVPTTPNQADDNRSQTSGSVKEKPSSNPLKRFGTVLGRRRQSAHPYGRATSPDRKSSSNLGSAFSGFGKGKSKDREPAGSPKRPSSPLRRISSTPRTSEPPESPSHARVPSVETPNGTAPEVPIEPGGASTINGPVQDTIAELKEPLAPPPVAETRAEPEKDSEGFSVPSSAVDAITEAEREAGL